MIKTFWYQAQSGVLHTISDTTGQSRQVDDYLGAPNSGVRKQISNAISRIITKIERTENLRSIDGWKETLEI